MGLDLGRFFPTFMLEREQARLGRTSGSVRWHSGAYEKTPAPAKEAAAKGAWEARQAGHVAWLASRRPTRCRFASACRAGEYIAPHPQERIA